MSEPVKFTKRVTMGPEFLDPELRNRRLPPPPQPEPYPDFTGLMAAARTDSLLVCHQCAGEAHRRASCPACLGTGYIRPCGRCFVVNDPGSCPICCGLHYTAGQPPDREATFNRSANPRTSSVAVA